MDKCVYEAPGEVMFFFPMTDAFFYIWAEEEGLAFFAPPPTSLSRCVGISCQRIRNSYDTGMHSSLWTNAFSRIWTIKEALTLAA